MNNELRSELYEAAGRLVARLQTLAPKDARDLAVAAGILLDKAATL